MNRYRNNISVCILLIVLICTIYAPLSTCSHADGVCGCEGDNVGPRAWAHTPVSDGNSSCTFNKKIVCGGYTFARVCGNTDPHNCDFNSLCYSYLGTFLGSLIL